MDCDKQETDQCETEGPADNFEPSWGYIWGIRLLVSFAILAIVAIWLIGLYGEPIPDRPSFITVNTLTVLAFVIIVITAYTSRETVAIMRHQQIEMRETRKLVKGQLGTMNGQLTEMKTQTANTAAQVMQAIEQTEAQKGQLSAIKNQITQFDDDMQLRLGAFVMPRLINVFPFVIDKKLRARIVIVNSGPTPAYDVNIYAHLAFKTYPFSFTHDEAKDMTDAGSPPERPSAIGPNGDTKTQDVFGFPLTQAMLHQEKETPLHFWGLITYTDIFGNERWSEFSYRKFKMGIIAENEICVAENEEGNDADRPKIRERPT